ncbi:MAG: HAMP domain-containing sensor histidine kinase [Eubacteriales bacterium]|nr:HAMP domain-containing sensor histidine kinase [Eubacteriales bacterium]
MKLRTKLTMFSILIIVLAVVICCALILSYVRNNELSDVTQTGIADFQSFSTAFQNKAGTEVPKEAIVRRSFLIGALRSVDGFEAFSLRQGDQYISNNTGFDIERFFADNESGSTEEETSVAHKILRVAGQDYFLAHAVIFLGSERYDLSFARNISAVTDEIVALAMTCAVVGLIITVLAAVAMWALVYRSMRPVNRLRSGAAELARGNYQSRIEIPGKNELSELAADFNAMADAVEANVDMLHEKTERQQAFINDLSHEMKTPITSILLSAETLLGRSVSQETLNRSLSRIYDQGKWLELLSQKLMTLVMLQGKLDLRQEHICDLFAAVKETTIDTLTEQGMSLETHCGAEIEWMDFVLMRSALVNLVMNARAASSAGEMIELRAHERVIEVIDHGAGIAPEEIARITEPFYRVDRSRSKKHGGAGLGLALVKRIVEAHEATLTIESVVSQGTRVLIAFRQPDCE